MAHFQMIFSWLNVSDPRVHFQKALTSNASLTLEAGFDSFEG